MTPFEITQFDFTREAVTTWAPLDGRNINWPVVYVLDNADSTQVNDKLLNDVYVGESVMLQRA